MDGALIIVENCMLRLAEAQHARQRLLQTPERFEVVLHATREVFAPSLVSVVVIVLVNLPIFALSGVEGKMFHPMAFAVIAALAGALIFSLTFVPAACALFLSGKIEEKDNRVVATAKRLYEALLRRVLEARYAVVGAAALLVLICGFAASRMGAEFIPNLDEGDLAIETVRPVSTGVETAVAMQIQLNRTLGKLPEVKTVFARNGTAEVATDLMPPGRSDTYVMLKPHEEWPDPAKPKAKLVEEIEAAARTVPGTVYGFSQPIQLRFNELISGVRSDVALKIFGDDLGELVRLAAAGQRILSAIPGAQDVKAEQASGLPLLTIEPRRTALARYGLTVAHVQDTVAAALGGKETGLIYEGDARYPAGSAAAGADAHRSRSFEAPAAGAARRRLCAARRSGRHPFKRGAEPGQPRERQALHRGHGECAGARSCGLRQ